MFFRRGRRRFYGRRLPVYRRRLPFARSLLGRGYNRARNYYRYGRRRPVAIKYRSPYARKVWYNY